MRNLNSFLSILFLLSFICACSNPSETSTSNGNAPGNSELGTYINDIKAVDNHAHPNTIEANDTGSDALPLDGLGNIELPARVRPESSTWVDAAKALYVFADTVMNEKNLKSITDSATSIRNQKKDQFPSWALDMAGIEVMIGNRISMGPGLASTRFRWASYVDALLFPLSTKTEAMATPDRQKLFPLEDQLLKKYLGDLHLANLPATLDGYLKDVVTAILESQKKGGCLAIKFEAAYLRSLDFEKASQQSASEVYAQFVHGGEPTHAQYKTLQDFLFFYVAREAGRLGMAVHIHSYPGAGNYFVAAGCDPLLLETAFNDPELRNTKFVIIHGGGTFAKHTSAMLWKPNVYADMSLLTQLWTPQQLSIVLRDWLSQFPEKILFGTDAVGFGPGLGWEMSAWIASTTGRQALTLALSGMVSDKEISINRAKEIANMVLRTNAGKLYNLGLK